MSYLSYYNMFDDFSAGAGVSERDLFTREEEESFLPKEDGDFKMSLSNFKGAFPDILVRNDVKSLIGLILFVLAITTTPVIAVIMIAVAAALIPFPSLVIAYCLSMQIINPGANKTTAMSIICVAMAIITIVVNSLSRTAYTISYIILAVLFCIYAFNLTKFKLGSSTISKCSREFRGGDKYGGENPSFYED
ncbi:IMV membrane phosphoprotein [Tanapox virus]|uniref:IMV membrane phosphoprotein n=2 Tax=Tanapox virus TaxID=99000 RepID=A7XCP0_9POXV|nr:109L protein [Yaba-like disease virus]ABQ43584.1 IMV membrane phosphoprotein [Tanapox virus]ABQ43739.1 IMV membrane phosphoprotein [Tanapox virus]CAC21347.1 109L protein [Yaba-like disease virus]